MKGEVALLLAEQGARVVLAARRYHSIQQQASRTGEGGGKALVVQVDARSQEQCHQGVENILIDKLVYALSRRLTSTQVKL